MYLRSGNDPGQARLYHQKAFDLEQYNKATLSFWIYLEPTLQSYDDRIQVQVKTGTSWQNAGPPFSRYGSSYRWEKVSVDLSDFTGDSLQLGFLGISDGGNDLRIDDVVLTAENVPANEPDDPSPPEDDDVGNEEKTGGGSGGCNISASVSPFLLLIVPVLFLIIPGKN